MKDSDINNWIMRINNIILRLYMNKKVRKMKRMEIILINKDIMKEKLFNHRISLEVNQNKIKNIDNFNKMNLKIKKKK